SFACFLERAADQIRMAGISRANLKLCGSHAGVSIGEDGPSQMALEDLALFRAIPEAVVFYPSDGVATDAAVRLAAARKGIVYIRTTRGKTPGLYREDDAFAVGTLKTLRRSERDRLAIVAAGITLHEALAAYDELAKQGTAVRVIDLFCVKPLDAAALLEAGRACDNRVLTVGDHYPEAGLGGAGRAAGGGAEARGDLLVAARAGSRDGGAAGEGARPRRARGARPARERSRRVDRTVAAAGGEAARVGRGAAARERVPFSGRR